MNRQLNQVSLNSGDDKHVYVNLRLDNILTDGNETAKRASIVKQMGSLLPHQDEYKLGVMFFQLNANIPVFVCPIIEGFINFGVITNITQAPIAVITTTTTTGLYAGLRIRITNINGMVEINGQYNVRQILSPNTFSINIAGTNNAVNSTAFNAYVSGGIIEKGQDNINLTPFGVCYSYGTNDYASPVLFQTNRLNPILPRPPSQNNGLQDISYNYYYVYIIQQFIDMMNTALQTAYNAFNTAHPGIHNAPVIFEYNDVEGTISMICPYSYSQAGSAKVYVNKMLYEFIMDTLPILKFGINQPNYKDYILDFTPQKLNISAYAPNGQTIPVYPATNPAYLRFTQEYDTRYMINNIKAVLFTSSTIQTRIEYMPSVSNFNSFVQGGLNTFTPNTQNIVSYFDVISTTGAPPQRQPLYYSPAFVKWIDLVSHNPLSSINIDILMELTNGQLIPLYIEPNTATDIKLAFIKRDINDM